MQQSAAMHAGIGRVCSGSGRLCCVLLAMVVLKGVPSVLSPELLYVLARMGHGDEIGE